MTKNPFEITSREERALKDFWRKGLKISESHLQREHLEIKTCLKKLLKEFQSRSLLLNKNINLINRTLIANFKKDFYKGLL